MSAEGKPSSGFMYLELSYDEEDHGLRATVKKTGSLHRSVGAENSRPSCGPIAVFAIDGFDGIDVIPDEELLREIIDRFGAARVLELMGAQLPKEVLIAEITKRFSQSR